MRCVTCRQSDGRSCITLIHTLAKYHGSYGSPSSPLPAPHLECQKVLMATSIPSPHAHTYTVCFLSHLERQEGAPHEGHTRQRQVGRDPGLGLVRGGEGLGGRTTREVCRSTRSMMRLEC